MLSLLGYGKREVLARAKEECQQKGEVVISKTKQRWQGYADQAKEIEQYQ